MYFSLKSLPLRIEYKKDSFFKKALARLYFIANYEQVKLLIMENA